MKTRISAGLAVVAVLLLALTAVAYGTTTEATLTSFKYDSAKKIGHLTVTAKHQLKIRVQKSTNCGVSRGQSGDQIPCKTLGKPKYAGKPVTVQYKKNAKGVRVASLVAVHL
jgi:hypothetical protein